MRGEFIASYLKLIDKIRIAFAGARIGCDGHFETISVEQIEYPENAHPIAVILQGIQKMIGEEIAVDVLEAGISIGLVRWIEFPMLEI